jgi:hypothetical protein
MTSRSSRRRGPPGTEGSHRRSGNAAPWLRHGKPPAGAHSRYLDLPAIPTFLSKGHHRTGPASAARHRVRKAAADYRCPVPEFGGGGNDARRRECHRGFTAEAVHHNQERPR